MNAPYASPLATTLVLWLTLASSSANVYAKTPSTPIAGAQLVATSATGPPANLKSGPFRSLVESMWIYSPRFRAQCQRLTLARELVVVLIVNTSDRQSAAHAWTEMSRKDGVLTLARVTIRKPDESIELIAHEIEHVIEQLDGVTVSSRAGAYSTHGVDKSYESERAKDAGRFVAREVHEGRGRIVSSVPGQDPAASVVDPAPASLSADGRFMAFTSLARLTPEDDNDTSDLYVLDIQSGQTKLESPPSLWSLRYRPVLYPRISGDGRFIAFQAVDTQGPTWWQTLVLDRLNRSVRVVSVSATGELANGHCTQATISADGSTVVFESLATNLVALDANGPIADIYAARLASGDMSRVSVATDGSQPRVGHSVTPTVSANGRLVGFMSTADLTCRSSCGSSSNKSRHPQIFVRDMDRGITSRISLGMRDKEANGASAWPALSGDGRFVAFVSEASNLTPGDNSRRADVFVVEISTGRTELVSHRADGRSGNGSSARPVISFDGQRVAFQSLASDLTCGDRCGTTDRDINMLWDVFVYDRSAGAMVRASADDGGEWMETSRTPSIDGSGDVLVFASRHPTYDRDHGHDDDLFLWIRGKSHGPRLIR